jgi:site-specific DNA recombinase
VTTRAGIYCRISKDRKDSTGEFTMLGVDRQEEDCRELCRTLGWEVSEVFVDNDVSATSGKARPAYTALLNAVAAGTIDAIVCWHPDRLYRRTVDLEELVKVCDKHRAPVATVNAGAVDLTTPTGRLVAGLLAQVARYEGEHKAERWRRSYQQRRQAGVPAPSGPRMYGWTRSGELIPEEASRIQDWARRILGGTTLHQIMLECQAQGVRTSRGNVWRSEALRQLLCNPRLAGWVTLKGAIVARSEWPPILTDEESEQVRALLAVRRGRRVYPRVAVLRGVVRCGVCDSLLMGNRRQDGSRSYKCPPVRGYGNGCVDIKAEPIEEVVEAYAQTRLADPRVKAAVAQVSMDGVGVRLAQEIATLETRLVALEAELVESDTDVSHLSRAITTVKGRIQQAQAELGGLVPVRVPVGGMPWPTSVERRNALIKLVVESVWVDRAVRGNPLVSRIRIEPGQ